MLLTNRWMLLAFTVLMQALILGTGTYAFGFFVVHWIAEFSAPRSELMIAYSATSLTCALISPIAGILVDKYSKRLLVIIGIGVYAAGLWLVSLATSPWLVILAYILTFPVGFTLGGMLICQTLIANAFDQNRGMALGISALGTSVGGLIMPIVVINLLDLYDWRTVFQFLSIFIFIVLAPLAMLIIAKTEVIKESPLQDQGTTVIKPKNYKALLQEKNVYLLSIAYLAPISIFIGIMQNVALHSVDLGISQHKAGTIIAMASAMMAVGKFLAGSLADRINYSVIYYSILALLSVGMSLIITAENYPQLAIGVVLVGGSSGGVMPFISTVASRMFGRENFGQVMGILLAAAALSGFAPLLAGGIRDVTGSYHLSFILFLPLVIPAFISFKLLSSEKSPVKIPQAPAQNLAD